MRFLNRIKSTTNLYTESVNYINNYQLIYRKVVKEARKRDLDRLISCAK
jgi:hypothetical protein